MPHISLSKTISNISFVVNDTKKVLPGAHKKGTAKEI